MVSAATSAAGRIAVPGWVSMRNVSHLPPARIISELTKAAPALVSLVPLHSTVAMPAAAGFFLPHQRQRLPAGRHVARQQGRGQCLQRDALGAVHDRRRKIVVGEVGDEGGEVAA